MQNAKRQLKPRGWRIQTLTLKVSLSNIKSRKCYVIEMTSLPQTYKNLINLPRLKRSIAIVLLPEDKNDLYVITFNLKLASKIFHYGFALLQPSCLDLLLLVPLWQEQKQDWLLTHAWPYFLSYYATTALNLLFFLNYL